MESERKVARYERLTRISRDVEVAEENVVFLKEGVHLGGLDAEMLASDGEPSGTAEEDNLLVADVDHCGCRLVCLMWCCCWQWRLSSASDAICEW